MSEELGANKIKSRVQPEHGNDQKSNGTAGCFTRWSDNGRCSGVRAAEWLNSMGDDDAPYFSNGSRPEITNRTVRENWVRAPNSHVTWETANAN